MGAATSTRREAQIKATCRRTSSKVVREQFTSASKKTLEVEGKRRETLTKTFLSICQSPQEIGLFKAFLHSEYDITLWDLYRRVDFYQVSRKTRVAEEERDTHERRLRIFGQRMYDRYLAPDAKCFVKEVPSENAADVLEALDAGMPPDCSELHDVLVTALCDEGLMQRFARWLKTDSAAREAVELEEITRQSAEKTSDDPAAPLESSSGCTGSEDGEERRWTKQPRSRRAFRNTMVESLREFNAIEVGAPPTELPDLYRESFRGSFGNSFESLGAQLKSVGGRSNPDSVFGSLRDHGTDSLTGYPSNAVTPKTPTTSVFSLTPDCTLDDSPSLRRGVAPVFRTSERVTGQRLPPVLDPLALPSGDDWPAADLTIPSSRDTNTSFGLTNILLRQWEQDQSEAGNDFESIYADHPMLRSPTVLNLNARSNFTTDSLSTADRGRFFSDAASSSERRGRAAAARSPPAILEKAL